MLSGSVSERAHQTGSLLRRTGGERESERSPAPLHLGQHSKRRNNRELRFPPYLLAHVLALSMQQVGRQHGQAQDGATWVAKDREVREKEKLGTYSWTLHHRLQGVPAVPRVHAVIDVAFLRAAKACASSSASSGEEGQAHTLQTPLFIDVSQCVSRRAAASSVKSICSSSAFYSFGDDRMIIPCEHMALLGWDKPNLDGISATATRDLAGAAMGLPPATLLAAAMCMQLQVWAT